MRLLDCLVLSIFYLGYCSCSKGSSVKPRTHQIDYSGSNLTAKPRTEDYNPSRTRFLKTAAEVFDILGNTNQESFAATFLKIDQNRLLSALRGVSIVARVQSTKYEKEKVILDQNSTSLANIVKKNVEKISEKVFTNTNFHFDLKASYTTESIKNKIQEELKGKKNDSTIIAFMRKLLYFNTLVAVPINITSHSMIESMKDGGPVSHYVFSKDYLDAHMESVISVLVQDTPILLNKLNISTYDKNVIEEYRSNFTRYFFQAFICQYYHIGVLSQRSPYSEEIKVQDSAFKIRHRYFRKIMREKSRGAEYKPLFPGSIKKTFVRPLIDIVIEQKGKNGSNCVMAGAIMLTLESNFPSHKFAVIVDDTRSTTDHYAYYGLPDRMIFDDYYGKTVVVFMASNNATENKNWYYDRSVASFTSEMNFDGKDLNTALQYAKNEGKNFQMAVFDTKGSTCFAPSESPNTDQFAVLLNEEKFGVIVVM